MVKNSYLYIGRHSRHIGRSIIVILGCYCTYVHLCAYTTPTWLNVIISITFSQVGVYYAFDAQFQFPFKYI